MWWIIVPWQLICCLMVQPLWNITTTQLHHYFPSIKTKSTGRQAYIIKNVAKALVLMFLTPPALWIINRIVFYKTWESALIKCMGAMYAASDIVAVVKMYDKLPLTTKIHHSCVVVFSLMNALVIDYNSSDLIWRHTAILAACSTPTYGVNAYLAIRCIDEISVHEKKRLANVALSIYSFFITLSAIWQMSAMFSFYATIGLHWDAYIYIGAVLLIFYDDWTLSGYLFAQSDCKKHS
mgnify:CR=1 FL=1